MTPKECRKAARIIERTIRSCTPGTSKDSIYSNVCCAVDREVTADEISMEVGDLVIALSALALLVYPRGHA